MYVLLLREIVHIGLLSEKNGGKIMDIPISNAGDAHILAYITINTLNHVCHVFRFLPQKIGCFIEKLPPRNVK